MHNSTTQYVSSSASSLNLSEFNIISYHDTSKKNLHKRMKKIYTITNYRISRTKVPVVFYKTSLYHGVLYTGWYFDRIVVLY